ncbi:tail fiber protein [Salmonella enterica]|uniref:tail fiber protein n=1 Tax=Salmonella enterica TaxID=28901 RepID=UPI001E36C072
MGADKTNNIMTLSSGVSQPLLADVQYFELYSSSALNRKLKNIVLPGFYCGFEPVPGTGLSVRITSENSEGKGAASVDVNNVQISVQQIEDVTVSVKAGATNIIVLEANFEHGVKTTQVDSASSVSAARIYARTDNTIGQNQIELCRVIVPSGATAVTKEMIVLKYRVNRAVGVEFSNEISSTEERKAATPLAVKTLHDLVDTKAPINSPNLTGTPTAPTATKGTNNTQIASTAFVMAAIAELVDSSPDALNTLNELAAALGNDPNFATTMTNALAGKQPKDATLTALAELATSADKLPYFTGADRAALTALTSVGRAILGKTSTQGVLDYLGLGETINLARNAVPATRRINSKPLTGDITLWASDVGALPIAGGRLNGALGIGADNALGGNSIVLGDNDTGFKQDGDGVLGIYANNARIGYIDNSGLHMSVNVLTNGGIRVGDGKQFSLTSNNNSTMTATFNLWGGADRPTVIELDDDQGWQFYSQRNTDGSISFRVNGQMEPNSYSNFDSRYVQDIRLGSLQYGQVWNGPGFSDTSGYVITGITNGNSDELVDGAHRRPIQKLIGNQWYNVVSI